MPLTQTDLFQSTLPHGERQAGGPNHTPTGEISIHAPAWGATSRRTIVNKTKHNFNPRSRMGSDCYPRYGHCTMSSFQSTLPHGERPDEPAVS